MSNGQDQFFEEEAQLAQPAKAQPKGKAASANAPAPKASAFTTTKPTRPPSFAMVVAIAAVALLLGFSIGYFVAVSTTAQRLADTVSDESFTSAPAATQSDNASGTQSALPSGHPDLSSFMNDDGTINEKAVEAFRAQNAG